MNKLIILIILSIIIIKFLNAQELYNFDLSNKVLVNGQSHFKINYYPNSNDLNYKGDFYPDLESNVNVKKYTFTKDCTITQSTNFLTAGIISPTLDTVDNPNGIISNANTVLIVPVGVKVTFGQMYVLPSLIIKGKVSMQPDAPSIYSTRKTIILPGGEFESIPTSSSFNHSIRIQNFLTTPIWDPLNTASFISLGGKVTIKGFDTSSIWMGSNNSFTGTSAGGSFIRSFPYTTNYQPIFKMSGTRANNNIVYKMENWYTKLMTNSIYGTVDSGFNGAGYIYMRPSLKNVWIYGVGKSSMLFTGPSVVSIENSVFADIGHTKVSSSPLDDNKLDSNLNVVSVGTNLPDRYPITCLHNTVAMFISNNMFMPNTDYSSSAVLSSETPRSFIGVKRSFGSIVGNAFALLRGSSGITFLYGTEQFNCSFNSFISFYSSDTTMITDSNGEFINGGIVTTSPYSIYNSNAFEGTFKGGALQIIPLQNRVSIAGLVQDQLLGTYSGSIQDNTMGHKINNLWSFVVFSNNFFAGEAEIRVTYRSEPSIKINLMGGWYIALRSSLSLLPNQANIELNYHSPHIASSLSLNDRKYIFNPNTHNGKYNAISIRNAFSPAGYTFFADSFKCKFISIKDSIFSHFSDTSDFIKKYTDQLILSNVNGTKTNIDTSIQFYYPLFDINILKSTGEQTSNGILSATTTVGVSDEITTFDSSFIPNFEYSESDGQSISYLINGQTNNYIANLYQSEFDHVSIKKTFELDTKTQGQLISFLISAKSYQPYLPEVYSESGPYYANLLTIDKSPNFYLGIDLSDPSLASNQPPTRFLDIFNKKWTKSNWISNKCITTGIYQITSNILPISSSSDDNLVASTSDEISMLSTSFLISDISNSITIPSTIKIKSLPNNELFKFYLYSYNPYYSSGGSGSSSDSSVLNALPLFTIKVNGNYQEPYSRSISKFGKFSKFGPFYWNSGSSLTNENDTTLFIEWASDNKNFTIPICGIEIYSSIDTPFIIPNDSPNGGGAIDTKTSTSSTGGDIDTPNISSKLTIHYYLLFISIFIITIFI